MEFKNRDFRFTYPQPKFEISVEMDKSINRKGFVESEMLSKRTPKCARYDENFSLRSANSLSLLLTQLFQMSKPRNNIEPEKS